MLVLSRKVGESVVVGDGVILTVLRSAGGRVRLGVTAPPDVAVDRPDAKAGPRPACVPPKRAA